ncbi:F-box protein SKIP1 [Camellia lanceoleosa]|uniref:F-box protein SKIP1 n=1 Tax=Camellia lanceoleosa TaxID=1840588 RepID=A0ACC0GK92_9ERIC|nr:F-box protein SKIP1 [Camellia lanceoleosa]
MSASSTSSLASPWKTDGLDPCLSANHGSKLPKTLVFTRSSTSKLTLTGSIAKSSLLWNPEFERRIDSMLRSVVEYSDGSLMEIRIRHCSDRSLSFVAQRVMATLIDGSARNLQVLSIKSCPNVTDESIVKIASGCPKLRELDVSYCYEISYKSLALIGKNCPDLKILKRNFMNWLDLSQHVGIGDSEAAAIGKFMPHSLHLELRFSKLSAKGPVLICEGCPNLEYLDLSGCANMTGRDIVNTS